ncbi:MAG TPA: stage V sporulation protein R, partial [Gammaproteobacteria bacterium]|nr:stage V sporulation protein R [Gammaproteobacteria bacterium]
MPANYSIEDLKYWEDQIQEKVDYFGLNCFPQEYEICDHNDMLGYMAYSGMPAHYPHWSYGKSFEKLKTMYDYGVSGLPYEMVINSNPCLAYLMRDNTLCLQVMTMAHVMGHNDFFANNFTFSHTHPELTLEKFKAQAVRVRNYIEDPSIGLERVENFLDSAHALMFNCNRNFAIKKRGEADARAQLSRELSGRTDLSDEEINKRLNRTPIEPDEDILLFIRDNQPLLAEWQRDLLTIVHYSASYFVPQIETKIINEGWASFWHRTIMNAMEVPNDIMLEFFAHHNRVVAPHPGSLNPYYLGVAIWDNILFH